MSYLMRTIQTPSTAKNFSIAWPPHIQGPAEAFHTPPAAWSEDVATLKTLVEPVPEVRACLRRRR